jgi:hypothetical protein
VVALYNSGVSDEAIYMEPIKQIESAIMLQLYIHSFLNYSLFRIYKQQLIAFLHGRVLWSTRRKDQWQRNFVKNQYSERIVFARND